MLHMTKSLFKTGMNCPLALWYQYHRPDLAPELSQTGQSRIDAGIEIGRIACQLFPGGKRVNREGLSFEEGITNTDLLIKDKSISAIFEGCFLLDKIRVVTDILERSDGNRWNIREVKSTTKVEDEHKYDIWIQRHVLTKLGIELEEVGVLHLNKDYKYDGQKLDLDKLFIFENLVSEIQDLEPELKKSLEEFQEIITKDRPPKIEPSTKCKGCEYLAHCTKDKPEHWIFYLPRISEKKWNQLTELGIEDIADIPDDFLYQAQ